MGIELSTMLVMSSKGESLREETEDEEEEDGTIWRIMKNT
jgi:hypothetical protein